MAGREQLHGALGLSDPMWSGRQVWNTWQVREIPGTNWCMLSKDRVTLPPGCRRGNLG
jgi:hypothetical protein